MPVAIDVEEPLVVEDELLHRATEAAERMLAALDLAEPELSVLLTDDETIRELNSAHRGYDEPTDVLAFPMDFADDTGEVQTAPEAQRLLGDVVISLPTAARQAAVAGHPLEAEVLFLLAHGILHLVGHDHADPTEKAQMDRETTRLLAAASPSTA